MALADWLFEPAGLTAHGFCLSWEPGLVALHAISDAVIGISYLSIPLALASLTRRRKDLQYSWMLYAFVGFIVACGATHLFSILTLWVPAYGLEGLVKAATAVLSLATAILLWPLVPRLVALPSPTQLRRLNETLSSTLARQEQTAEQLRLSEARVQASNVELERRVAERTADLETAKQDLERVLADRTKALEQRDLLLREVYHRVKNNLQIVDGLLVMRATQLQDVQAKHALLDLRSRIYALGLVHHQLMGSDDLKTFDVRPFLNELSANLLDGATERGIEIVIDAFSLPVGLDFAVPFGLIVTELVTNAIKHAFPDRAGRISVQLQPDQNGGLLLVVRDDGIGQPEASAAAAPSTGLGMTIVKSLVSQLEGTIVVYHDAGTGIEMHFPLPVQR
jgi:two-component sensor histidine kinase